MNPPGLREIGRAKDCLEPEGTVNVFVYGTLMPGQCNYDPYCRPYLKRSTRGYVLGHIYHLPWLGYPGVCDGTDRVWGYCLSFGPGFSLTALDALEDYDPQRQPDQNEYHRCRATVFAANGDRLSDSPAWIYRMTLANIQRHRGIYLPSGQWTPQEGKDFSL
ncbi:MAG: gamma-glutamylcyclotransferase [Synechocystis sp.]|nr:gamma-glutamylcyclotransferase [Synechocystis sp.]